MPQFLPRYLLFFCLSINIECLTELPQMGFTYNNFTNEILSKIFITLQQ